MIQYFKGCVVEAFASGQYAALMHQANCHNTMNSGVARTIREKFPAAFKADCATPAGDIRKLGGFTQAPIEGLGRIFNLYGQYNYGKDGKKYTRVDKLAEALDNASTWMWGQDEGQTICLPKLGCGLGGADWDTEVAPIITSKLIARGFLVHVYEK
jgi:O-acetyl-ADP-ribose deacetylase (regulator of RNase III)